MIVAEEKEIEFTKRFVDRWSVYEDASESALDALAVEFGNRVPVAKDGVPFPVKPWTLVYTLPGRDYLYFICAVDRGVLTVITVRKREPVNGIVPVFDAEPEFANDGEILEWCKAQQLKLLDVRAKSTLPCWWLACKKRGLELKAMAKSARDRIEPESILHAKRTDAERGAKNERKAILSHLLYLSAKAGTDCGKQAILDAYLAIKAKRGANDGN